MNEREIDEIDNELMLTEMYTGPSQTTEMYTVPVENNNCKSKNGLIFFLVLCTLFFFGLFIYYFVSLKLKEKKDVQSGVTMKNLQIENNNLNKYVSQMSKKLQENEKRFIKINDITISNEGEDKLNAAKQLVQYLQKQKQNKNNKKA
jgi:hypothetical protein